MKKIILTFTLISATTFGKATNLTCEWKDPAKGIRWASLQVFPFPVPPPSVIPIEAFESATGDTAEKTLNARYVTLNVDATPSSFPLGVYIARDARDVSGTFPVAENIELRITEIVSKHGELPVVDSVSKGMMRRTTKDGQSQKYHVQCRGMLISTH